MISDTEPCDLQAGKSGTVVRTVVRSGICQVKTGDVVEIGELLVDGTIPVYDDASVMVDCYEVHSDAEIYAETTYSVDKKLALTETIRMKSGDVRNGIFIKIFDRSCCLLPPDHRNREWEYLTEQVQVKFLNNFYLPIYWGTITANEVHSYDRFYTKEDIEGFKDRYLMEYMEKLQEKGIQILGNDVKIEHSESGWQITGTLSVIENIAREIPITETGPQMNE